MNSIRCIVNYLHNWWRGLSLVTLWRGIVALFVLAAFAVFFDWMLLNWLSGCCNGGECIPEWVYPQCQSHRSGRHD